MGVAREVGSLAGPAAPNRSIDGGDPRRGLASARRWATSRSCDNQRGPSDVQLRKVLATALGVERVVVSGVTIEDGALVLRKPASAGRAGWAEAARRIAESGDDELVMGEFGNADDSELVW